MRSRRGDSGGYGAIVHAAEEIVLSLKVRALVFSPSAGDVALAFAPGSGMLWACCYLDVFWL